MPRYVPAGGMRGFTLTGGLRGLSVKEIVEELGIVQRVELFQHHRAL